MAESHEITYTQEAENNISSVVVDCFWRQLPIPSFGKFVRYRSHGRKKVEKSQETGTHKGSPQANDKYSDSNFDGHPNSLLIVLDSNKVKVEELALSQK
jgi:hypothetical protein